MANMIQKITVVLESDLAETARAEIAGILAGTYSVEEVKGSLAIGHLLWKLQATVPSEDCLCSSGIDTPIERKELHLQSE
jgi:hypothetical protein